MTANLPLPALESKYRVAGERALSLFIEAGSIHVDPPVLQPANAFLDMSGEEIRGRLYMTSDPSGVELCLRPDFTIPVCRAYLEGRLQASPALLAYLGPVFRATPGRSGEMKQTGIECYGRTDIEAADAEILTLVLEAAESAGSEPLSVTFGDVRVFDAVIDSLGLPAFWRRRVRRGLAEGKSLESIMSGVTNGLPYQLGVLAALERTDHSGAKALVRDLLEIAGIKEIGGRDVGEIADRFLLQASQRASEGVSSEQRAILSRFLAISGNPDSASGDLRSLARQTNLTIEPLLDSFDERTGFFAARGLEIGSLTYATAFVRELDYYTGFVFEARRKTEASLPPAVVGGRYDGLGRRLGANFDLPAVGAAIWIDRLPLKGARN